MTFVWDKFQADLERLAANGLSADKVSSELSALAGESVSRNAVIGRCRRTKVPLKCAGIKSKKKRPRPRQVAAAPRDTSSKCSILDLTANRCAFICGDPRTPLQPIYCGAETIEGRPYCQHHCGRAYVPLGQRRVDAA